MKVKQALRYAAVLALLCLQAHLFNILWDNFFDALDRLGMPRAPTRLNDLLSYYEIRAVYGSIALSTVVTFFQSRLVPERRWLCLPGALAVQGSVAMVMALFSLALIPLVAALAVVGLGILYLLSLASVLLSAKFILE